MTAKDSELAQKDAEIDRLHTVHDKMVLAQKADIDAARATIVELEQAHQTVRFRFVWCGVVPQQQRQMGGCTPPAAMPCFTPSRCCQQMNCACGCTALLPSFRTLPLASVSLPTV